MDLIAWQNNFKQSLLGDLDAELNETFQSDSKIKGHQRFLIYRNNVFYSLVTALGDLYPLFKKLVGEDLFKGIAAEFIRNMPPKKAALVYYGSEFPEFLKELEIKSQKPYWVEVCQIELARHQAYYCVDQAPISLEEIQQMDVDELQNKKVVLHPSLTTLCSDHSSFSVWQNLQDHESVPEQSIQSEVECILIFRPEYDVNTILVDCTIFFFISKLIKGISLGDALEQTIEEHIEFQASKAFAFLLNQGLVVKFIK
jgi:hypothetical protein